MNTTILNQTLSTLVLPSDGLLHCGGQVLPEVEPVGDLHRLRRGGPHHHNLEVLEHLFYFGGVSAPLEHWFNRRYGPNRRDVYLTRTPSGWQVLGRIGGAEGTEVVHYFDKENDARQMLRRMLNAVPDGQGDWAQITAHSERPR